MNTPVAPTPGSSGTVWTEKKVNLSLIRSKRLMLRKPNMEEEEQERARLSAQTLLLPRPHHQPVPRRCFEAVKG